MLTQTEVNFSMMAMGMSTTPAQMVMMVGIIMETKTITLVGVIIVTLIEDTDEDKPLSSPSVLV